MSGADLGYLFKEEMMAKAGIREGNFPAQRVGFFRLVFIIAFAVLATRLLWLQIIEGERNRVLSEENRILARTIQAPRGVISDCRGEALAQNAPVYRKVNENCGDGGGENGVSDCQEYLTISREEALKLQAGGESEKVRTMVGRQYLFGPEIAPVVGYVGEVDSEELGLNPDYKLGDWIGKMGVEREYESLLKGKDGAELVEVDVQGEVVREVAKKEPAPGIDLQLTVDVRLQEKAYQLMAKRPGSLVALEPSTGSILALVSVPSFDPREVWQSLHQEGEPFFQRAIAGLYPPGSVFKLVTATAGLEEGKITPSTEIEDTGEIRIGSYRYGNWYFDQYGSKEGLVNVVRALKRSNDIFFYKVGELVGAARLADWAKKFGYGAKTGVDLPGEAEGFVPTPLWKERQQGERWFLGNTYHFAIGQSDLTVTPLQVARVTAAAASGKLCRPHLLEVSELEDSTLYKLEIEENYCRKLELAETTWESVREGMKEACAPGGTAFPFFNFTVAKDGVEEPLAVACKTGTAQFGDPQDRTHAWFTVYAPYDQPEIAVVVMLEKAGEGSYEAAPVAKEFLKYYFELRD